MANPDSLAQQYPDVVGYYKLASIRATQLNTAGNAVITLPILSGGMTNGGGTANSGGVILRRVTVQNPSGSIATANVSIGVTNDGANLVTANTVLSSVTGTGKFQDISIASAYQTQVVSGATTQCLYVNVNTASGNSSTCDIIVWGDVVSF